MRRGPKNPYRDGKNCSFPRLIAVLLVLLCMIGMMFMMSIVPNEETVDSTLLKANSEPTKKTSKLPPKDFQIETISPGDGKNFPQVGDMVRVHYTGTLWDGTKFDSSHDRGRPFQFKMGAGQVIKGWDKGIQMMSFGQIARLILPPEYAYGKHGHPPKIPESATLIFEVELMWFSSLYKPTTTTSSSSSPPPSLPPITTEADSSSRGFTIEVLKPGDGKSFPRDGNKVTVHYTGTLTNGKKFDSSRDNGRQPFEFQLGKGAVIRGWDEGVKLMSLGEIARLTLPPEYAYGVSGYPPVIPESATLIFEIELLAFS